MKTENHMDKLVVLASAALAVLHSAFAVDGTILLGKTDYGASASWQDGIIANGDGATMYIEKAGTTDLTMTTNTVLGHIIYSAELATSGLQFNMDAYRTSAQYLTKQFGEEWYTHLTWNASAGKVIDPTLFGFNTNSLTLKDTATGLASIERLSSPKPDYSERITHRLLVTMPVKLESDLTLKANARYTASQRGDAFDVCVVGDLTEVGGKRKIIVDHTHDNVVSYFGGENDFTGDLIVSGGTVRAEHRLGRRTDPCLAFGHDNAIVQASTNSQVNLHGQSFSENQTLYLGGGLRSNKRFSYLSNEDADPQHKAVWRGPVKLHSYADIGGTGAIDISGDITEMEAGSGLRVVAEGPIRLTGNNTYSGSTILGYTTFPNQTGFFSCRPESVGTGPIVFAGGFWRMYEMDDADCTKNEIIVSNSSPVKIELKGDFVYTPKGRIDTQTLWKGGDGAIRFTKLEGEEAHKFKNSNKIERGDMILDYADGCPISFSDWNSSQFSFYHNSRLVITNLTADTGSIFRLLNLGEFSKLSLWNASDYSYTINGMDVRALKTGLINVEDGGPIKMWSYNGAEFGNVGVCGGNFIWQNRTWAGNSATGTSGTLQAFDGFVMTWAGAATSDAIDLTAANITELASRSTPVEVGVIRVNGLGASGDEVVVTFPEGTNVLNGGTILITPEMGARNVRFTGGALMHPGLGVAFRVLNYSTGTVTIENDIVDIYDITNRTAETSKYAYNTKYWVASPMIGTYLVTDGNGKIVFTGDNRFTGDIVMHGGWTEFVGTESLGAYGHNAGIDNFCGWVRDFHLVNGAKVSFKGEVEERIFTDATFSERMNYRFFVHPAPQSAEISLPETTDKLSLTMMYSSFHPFREAKVKVTGRGMIDYSGSTLGIVQMDRDNTINPFWNNSTAWPQVADVTYEDITLVGATHARVFGTCRLAATLNGATLRGKDLLNAAWETDGNQSLLYDHTYKMRYTIREKGATFDLNGGNASFNTSFTYWNASAFFAGSGTITLTNTSTTAAIINCSGLRSDEFTGKIVLSVNIDSNGGLATPNADMVIPAGCQARFSSNDKTSPVELTYLEGDGTLVIHGGNSRHRASAFIGGGVAGETHEFAGCFVGIHSGTEGDNGVHGEFVKVGKNTQILSCTTNCFTAVTTVRDGVLQFNADSTDSTTFYPVSIGDCETPTDGIPTFLSGAGVKTGAKILIPSLSPSTALPAVGGAAGTVAYTNTVTAWRDFAVVANAGTTTFEKAIKGGNGDLTITKKGAGKVVFAAVPDITGVQYAIEEGELELPSGDVTASDFTSSADGTLVVNGIYTIPDGTVLKLDVDVSSLDKAQTYTLVRTTGGVSGRFTCNTLPTGWTLSYSDGSVTLKKIAGFVIIYR